MLRLDAEKGAWFRLKALILAVLCCRTAGNPIEAVQTTRFQAFIHVSVKKQSKIKMCS